MNGCRNEMNMTTARAMQGGNNQAEQGLTLLQAPSAMPLAQLLTVSGVNSVSVNPQPEGSFQPARPAQRPNHTATLTTAHLQEVLSGVLALLQDDDFALEDNFDYQ
jgi:hypothetical protein